MTHRLTTESTAKVLAEVSEERSKQEAKWGQQNHPDGTGPNKMFLGLNESNGTYLDLRNKAIKVTDSRADMGILGYSDIFLEEVFEAMAEEDQDRLREELVQCAAVAVAWIEKIDRDKERKE